MRTVLAPFGFARTKTTFWTNPKTDIVQFMYLHLYSFQPSFCITFGIRVLNDSFDAAGLNGPTSSSHRSYNLAFGETPESIDKCVSEIDRFYRDIGGPWFHKWNEPEKLVTDADSPLNARARQFLGDALNNRNRAENLKLSKKILGIG